MEKIWKEIFYVVVDYINGKNKPSESCAEQWTRHGGFLNLYAQHRDIESHLLYEKTTLLQYLSEETKDIFVF